MNITVANRALSTAHKVRLDDNDNMKGGHDTKIPNSLVLIEDLADSM
jgi:hypothetical protein